MSMHLVQLKVKLSHC